MTLPPPPRALDSESARLLREAFARAEFDFNCTRSLGLIGAPGWKASTREKAPRLATFACGVLVRFFVVRDPLPPDLVAQAVGGAAVLAALEAAGTVVKLPDGTLQCPFQLTPVVGAVVMSDAIDDPASASPPEEYIIPVSGAARAVDDLTVREPCDLAVDLACGQGYHALRSMPHARRSIATDINPRAIAFARANAALHGVPDRVEVRPGSFYEPLSDVAGKIDLLTCNPPFVMQPGAHVTSAVSATEGDGMIEGLVKGLPPMLREGGWGTMCGLWENADPRHWHSRVSAWLAGSACDALILQFQTYLPDEYLQAWFPPDVRAGIVPGWRVLCERRKIAAVTYGAIIVRKRVGQNWLATLSTPIFARSGSASEQVKAFFASQTALQNMWGPVDLLDRRLRIAAGWRFDPAQGTPRSAPTGVSRGLALPVANAARVEQMLASFDGISTARDIVAGWHASGRINLPPDHPEVAQMLHGLVTAGCLDVVS